jgi:hypothetical protein
MQNTCTSTTGETGICTHKFACVLSGGRPGGSCHNGKVCCASKLTHPASILIKIIDLERKKLSFLCLDVITSCERTVTLNNTYWHSPSTGVESCSTCALTIVLDSKFKAQKDPICQIR